MNDGKTPKKPIKKEDNSKNSKQTNNVKVQKESCDTKAKHNPRIETRIDETIDNDSFKKETCESKAKINEHVRPTLKQVVTQKETCTKLLPNKLPSQRPFLDLPTTVKECSSKDFIAPNGIKSPAQKSGAIKKTPKLLPIYQVLPQDKSTTKRDEIQIKNFQVEALGSDKIRKTITIEHTKYPASTHCGSKLQSIDNQKFAPSQANKSDIQRYLINKMAKLSGASFQRHGLPDRSVPTDNIEAKLEPVKMDAKQIDYERKQVYIKDRTEIDQSKNRDFTQDQFPTEVGANQLEVRDFGRKRGCLKESTKKLDPRAKYQKDDKIIEGSESKIEKRHDLSTAGPITTDNKLKIKTDKRAEEQLKMIEVPFADFIRDQYKETHADFETSDEQLQVEHKKESCCGKIEEVPEILYKGKYKLRSIHENLPECYKLFDLSRDFEKQIEILDTEVAIEKSALIPDQPVIVETDYIIPRKGGCIPECGQEPIIQPIKEKMHQMTKVLEFSEEIEFEEPKYHTATITQLELTTEPEFGIDFELQQGVLTEPYDILQGPPYRVPPKLYIAKDATLAEYDYIYEKIDKEKKIKKIEVQIARRRKLQEKPQFSQYIQQDKSTGVYRYEKHKGLSMIIEPVYEKATVMKTQEAADQRMKRKPEAQYVDSYYKYEKPEPMVLEQAVAIKSKYTSTKLKSESVKDAAHYRDSDYIYEKLKDRQLVIVPEIHKAIISKVQAVPNQTSKMRVKPVDYVDSDYKYEECKEEKRPIQAEQVFFENAKVSKINYIAIPKTQYKDKSIAQRLDSNYRFEKSIQEKDPVVFQKATFRKDREIPECKIKPKETDDPHFVDSEYEYEPPSKTSILEPIKIQTATIIHHHIDEPEYNVMINEHDAIWMNFVYKYEKIRPDLLEKITQNNYLIEIPERKQTHRDVYKTAMNKYVPTANRPKINVMKVPEFQIIPESFEESQQRPGPSTAFPQIESRYSSFGKRTKSGKRKWIRKLLKILKIHI